MSPQKGSKASTEEPATTEQDSAWNDRVPCQELDHPDDEPIYASSFPFDELFPKMKKHKCIEKLKNLFTGALFSDVHHMKNKGLKSLKDFYNFDACFCAEWVKVMINDQPYWVRCGNMFNRLSPGCTDHLKASFKDGPNRIYTEMGANRPGNWGMLKNKYLEHEVVPQTAAQKAAEKFASMQKKISTVAEQLAAMYETGQDTTALEAEQLQRLQLISKMRKDRFPPAQGGATLQQSGGNKAQPAASTDGLRHGGATGISGGRKKSTDSATGDRLLNAKAKAKQNPNGRRNIQATVAMLATIAEEEPVSQRKKPRHKNQGGGGGDMGTV
jgi:hypothetical protein